MPLQQVPAANRNAPGPGATLGAYTVGAATTSLVSIHGAAGGQDVMGWPSVSDLNYKYGLVHVPVKKLCAAHLLPALLGGQTTNQNLTPIPNEANGWLSANPERAAKQMVFSEGACVRYQVTCAFDRAVAPPIEGDVAALVPSGFEVSLTKLRWNGTDPSTNWDNYEDDGEPQVFTVPANLLALNDAAMSDGVQRADLNRLHLQNGMR